MNTVTALKTVTKNIGSRVEAALRETGGLLRLAPCWVPRSFLQPGKRLKLHPDDLYAYGLNRGGIDERWFASTTPAANENRTPDEGLSYVLAGLEPGTTKAQVRKCLEDWNKGDNGILDLSRAYRLKPGTGWLIPPCVLHAPGSLCTYEPQWGSDVFGMYQSLVEGREVPWSLLVKDMPRNKHRDLDWIVDQLDWEGNCDPHFKDNHYLEPVPVADTRKEGYMDRWIVYGKIAGEQLFSAKELTVEPGVRCTIRDKGAYGLICVQGLGRINDQPLNSPKLIRFTELTEHQ